MIFTMPTLGARNNLAWLHFHFLIGQVSTAQAFATRHGNGTRPTQYYRTVALMVRAVRAFLFESEVSRLSRVIL